MSEPITNQGMINPAGYKIYDFLILRLKHKRTFFRSGPAGIAPCYGLHTFAGARYQWFQQLVIIVIGFGGQWRDFSDRNTPTLVHVNINIYIYMYQV